jgi:GntR family transcriptional regulator
MPLVDLIRPAMILPYQDSHLLYSIPLYIQIAEGLIGRIESGELVPGDRLPPERELSEKLGVNRMTLRRSLRVLEAQGLIVRKHGVGTYVAEPKIDRQMDTVFRFTRGMEKRGYTPGARLISLEQSMVDAALARELAVPVSSLAYRIIRLRSINQAPVLIESEYDVTIVRARQSFEPVLATAFESDLLEVKIGAPLMLERRISFDQNDQPVESGRDRYRGDRFRFVTEAAPFEF